MAAAAMGLGAGLALQGVGCGSEAERGPVTTEGAQMTTPALPALDLNAPAQFQTATFAFG
jgi:hypothetical protein